MRRILLLMGSLLLASCGNVGVEHYARERPTLDLAAFFSRPVQAWGLYQNRSGEVLKRFHVQIESHREGQRLILDERFVLQRRYAPAAGLDPGTGWPHALAWPGERCDWRSPGRGRRQRAALALSP